MMMRENPPFVDHKGWSRETLRSRGVGVGRRCRLLRRGRKRRVRVAREYPVRAGDLAEREPGGEELLDAGGIDDDAGRPRRCPVARARARSAALPPSFHQYGSCLRTMLIDDHAPMPPPAVASPRSRHWPSRRGARLPPAQCLGALPLAGFQVSIIGRFWVSTEACRALLASSSTVSSPMGSWRSAGIRNARSASSIGSPRRVAISPASCS